MCKIGINLINTTPNGTNIVSAIGQYRMVGSATWTNFNINLTNPETPNITNLGSYELRVNITNNVDDTSSWSNISTFQVTNNCSGSDTSSGNTTTNLETVDYLIQYDKTSILDGQSISDWWITYQDYDGSYKKAQIKSLLTEFSETNILVAHLCAYRTYLWSKTSTSVPLDPPIGFVDVTRTTNICSNQI